MMTRFILVLMTALLPFSDVSAENRGFDVFELTIPELQAALAEGATTSRELVSRYLERIDAFDHKGPQLNAVIYINPRAHEEAEALDRERALTGPRGPLHGIPVLLKDNYDTHDMPTTASAVALAGFVPPDDGFQVSKLRAAGAVFIGKTNMHEFARGIETISSLGGQTLNPYDPGRNPGGSSGGTAVAVAASFAAVGMGSDTCGSIRIPAAHNNLFGLRVTQGLSSRDGIIPLSHTQDVAGPLARSMIDLVTVLDVTVGPDPADEQTLAAAAHVPESYVAFLQKDALKGARLGLLAGYLDTQAPFGEVSKVVRDAVRLMADNGAEIVELEIEGLDELLKDTSVIDIEFRFDLAKYLEQSNAPVKSLEEVLETGNYHAALESRYRRSLETEVDSDDYRNRLAGRKEVARLLLEAMTSHKLDALVYPALRVKAQPVGEAQYGSLCRIAAHSGLPAIAVPAGFTADGLPVGVEFLARPFEESHLVALGYAWEQLAKPRRPPARTPSLVSDPLVYPLRLDSPAASGELRFDRPGQTLHYALQIPDIKEQDILDIKVHRGPAGASGPVIALLGKTLQGSLAIPNAEVGNLLEGRLYLVVYTRESPFGAVRGQILWR
jgi:Asp-tRNA(Asn)/Glu-tRNA(Gln) amidotransferase A subunit family amidase